MKSYKKTALDAVIPHGYRSLLIMLFVCLSTACSHKNRPVLRPETKSMAADTTVVHQHRQVEPFHGVRIAHVSTVDIEIGSACEVQVEGCQTLVHQENCQVADGCLQVNSDQQDTTTYRKLHVRIKAPTLDELQILDAGQVTVHGKPLQGKDLTISLSRVNVAHLNACMQVAEVVADIRQVMFTNLHVDCQQLKVQVQQSQHVQLIGKAYKRQFLGDQNVIDTHQLQ